MDRIVLGGSVALMEEEGLACSNATSRGDYCSK